MFAGNISQADMELPPQEVIEKLRDVLENKTVHKR
jgi:hypothetical protein